MSGKFHVNSSQSSEPPICPQLKPLPKSKAFELQANSSESNDPPIQPQTNAFSIN
jgi:hypothetical protein